MSVDLARLCYCEHYKSNQETNIVREATQLAIHKARGPWSSTRDYREQIQLVIGWRI